MASMSAVLPYLSLISRPAPLARSTFVTARLPYDEALCKGVPKLYPCSAIKVGLVRTADRGRTQVVVNDESVHINTGFR